MISTLPIGIIGSVASMLAATLYQWKYDRKHNLWNLGSAERYILHMRVLLFVIFGVYMSQYTSVPISGQVWISCSWDFHVC